MLSNLDRSTDAEGFNAQLKQTFEQVVDGHVGLGRGEQRSAALLCKVVEQVGGRGGFPGSRWALNEGQTTRQGSLNRRLLGSVEMLVVGERPALDSLPTNVRGEFSALVDVKDVPEDEFTKHRPAIAFSGMEGHEGFVHAVVSDSVGASVKSPAAFPDITWSFTDHHANPGGSSVEHDPFNHLLAPRAGARNEHDIAVGKTMLGEAPAVLGLENHDVFAEETALDACLEVKQRHARHQQALLGPTLPSFFHQLGLIVQLLLDEVRHRRKVVLASPPAVGSRFAFDLGQLGVAGAVHALDRALSRHVSTTGWPLIIVWMKIEAISERQTLSLKQRIHGPQPGEFMFGRKKKDADVVGVSCPYCGVNNPLGSEQCEQCYYSLNKSARDQPMAEPSSTNDEIMSLLLGDNEEEEDTGPVVEAVLSLDDVTVEVDQYSITETEHDEEGEPVPESFEFIGSQGPTLSSTVASQEPTEVELTAEDAPKTYVEFDLGNVDPLAEVAEPVHTGRGGLYSPTVEAPKDDDLLGEVGPAPNATPDLPDLTSQAPPQGASLAQAMATETPDLPDLPEEVPISQTPTASQPMAADVAVSVPATSAAASPAPSQSADIATPETPDLPDLPGDEPATAEVAEPAPPETEQRQRIWPWPKGEAWTPTQVYQEVVGAMEHVKHGRMEAAANALDQLGPHLEDHLDMLLHVSVLMQHLGRHEHMKWTLDMAAYVHPTDPHVQQARAQLLT